MSDLVDHSDDLRRHAEAFAREQIRQHAPYAPRGEAQSVCEHFAATVVEVFGGEWPQDLHLADAFAFYMTGYSDAGEWAGAIAGKLRTPETE